MALPPSEGLPVPRARDLLIKGKLPEGSVPQAQLFYASEPRLAAFQACAGDTARLICLLSPGKAQGELKLARSLWSPGFLTPHVHHADTMPGTHRSPTGANIATGWTEQSQHGYCQDTG